MTNLIDISQITSERCIIDADAVTGLRAGHEKIYGDRPARLEFLTRMRTRSGMGAKIYMTQVYAPDIDQIKDAFARAGKPLVDIPYESAEKEKGAKERFLVSPLDLAFIEGRKIGFSFVGDPTINYHITFALVGSPLSFKTDPMVVPDSTLREIEAVIKASRSAGRFILNDEITQATGRALSFPGYALINARAIEKLAAFPLRTLGATFHGVARPPLSGSGPDEGPETLCLWPFRDELMTLQRKRDRSPQDDEALAAAEETFRRAQDALFDKIVAKADLHEFKGMEIRGTDKGQRVAGYLPTARGFVTNKTLEQDPHYLLSVAYEGRHRDLDLMFPDQETRDAAQDAAFRALEAKPLRLTDYEP